MDSGTVISLSDITEISPEGQEMMMRAMERAYLIYFNHYLFEHGVITREIYYRMDLTIKTKMHKRGELK